MNYISFQNHFKDRVIIPVNDVLKIEPGFDKTLLVDWQDKGYIIKIINRYYAWSNKLLTEEQLFSISNKIYSPSYISHKSALRFYNFIPEGVYHFFAVTTRKTINFDTAIGFFDYKHVDKKHFFGYMPITLPTSTLLIAEPEKAILDTLYLSPYIKDNLSIDGLRLNYELISEKCSMQKMMNYAELMGNKRVIKLTKYIIANCHD